MILKVFEAVYLPENVTARVVVVWGRTWVEFEEHFALLS